MATINAERLAQRRKIVHAHIEAENEHNLEAVLATWGDSIIFDDASGGQKYVGAEDVRNNYDSLFSGFPDMKIDIKKEHILDNVIILEVDMMGTHQGSWIGIPPTNKYAKFAVCALFEFDENDKLSVERVYYDRAGILMQLGVIPMPS